METVIEKRVETEPATKSEPILVATDGLPQSRGALKTARALADRFGTTMRVVSVHQWPMLVIADGQTLLDPSVAQSIRDDLVRRVREQCTLIEKKGPRVDACEVLNGEPARVITESAVDKHARLIVVGLGRHELVDRIFGDETALKVARLSHVPVLAVPEHGAAAPRHAVVGVDFSEGSVRAAEGALRLLADDGLLELVHVIPRERLLFDTWVSEEDYTRYVRQSLTRFVARLDVPSGVRVEDVILSGDAAREIQSYASRAGADLIAAGSHGHGFVTRLVVGSVTTKLLRMATCAVLVIPADIAHSDRNGAASGATLTLDRERWREVLDDFTQSNVGRRTRLEVNDPELGAQAQEQDYPLLGVTFDPVDERVEIMLGELGAGEPHLSRSVGEVDSLDVLTDDAGRDVALRLHHGSGQTILTLLR
ncbi:MAG TPA: universal stress protein [Gemmatimonadaceae bacterium]